MKNTFSIGGVHPNDSKIAAECAIEDFPIVEKAYISMSQHLGAPAEPIVEKGAQVKVGDLIAKKSGFVSANIHSSVSGTVTAIETIKDLAGNKIKSITIKVDGDEWNESIDRTPDIVREIKLSPEEIIQKIEECGIVGMGGASFPTHIKLAPPPGKKAECIILNGAECEPYLTSDYRILMENTEEILLGARIMMKALGVTQGYIGIEENKPKAIAKVASFAAQYPEIKLVVLKKKYPQGGEKQLIDAVIHRQVPSMGLPIDTGAVVQNCGTALAVYEAVQKNKPLFEGIITVTGKTFPQHNFRLRAGTPLSKIIEHVGGLPDAEVKVISGGPMMGKAVANLDAPSVKSSSSILVMTREETLRAEEGVCIRCGKCIDACPMGLEPYLLNKYARLHNNEELEANKVYDCIECGSCMFACPAHLYLLDYIRIAKGEVMRIIKSRPRK